MWTRPCHPLLLRCIVYTLLLIVVYNTVRLKEDDLYEEGISAWI